MTFNSNKIFTNCETLLKSKLSSSLIFITRKTVNEKQVYEFKRVLLNKDVQTSFQTAFLKKISWIKKKLDKKRFDKYSPTNTSDSIKYISKNDVKDSLLKLNKDEVEVIKTKELTKEFFKELWGYIVIFEDTNNISLRIFRRYTPGNILKKSLLNAFIIKDGTFTKLDKDIFKIDYKIHCFLFDGFLTIFSKKNFEELFELEEKFREESKEILKEIGQGEIKVTNWDNFTEKCCDNIIMMRKLSNIKTKGDYKTLSFEKVKLMKKNYNLKFEIDETKKEIKYEKYKDIWDILALFDDDLLRSEMTEKRYEVSSKKEKKRRP